MKAALIVLIALTLTACGGGDEPLSGPQAAATTATAATFSGSNVGYYAAGTTGPFGSLTPGSDSRFAILSIYQAFGDTILDLNGSSLPQNAFTTLTINGVSFSSSAAYSFVHATGPYNYTEWVWHGTPNLVAGSSYDIYLN